MFVRDGASSGARPKWNKGRRPPVGFEQTTGVDIGAAGSAVGRSREQRGASSPVLSLEQHNLQDEELRTLPRREAREYRSQRGTKQWSPPGGTRAVSQTFTDVRVKDVGQNRRSDDWSPGNVLENTVAYIQRNLADLQAESQLLITLEKLLRSYFSGQQPSRQQLWPRPAWRGWNDMISQWLMARWARMLHGGLVWDAIPVRL